MARRRERECSGWWTASVSESFGSGSIAVLRRNCQPPVCRWLSSAGSVEKVSLGPEKVRNKQASQQAGEGKKKQSGSLRRTNLASVMKSCRALESALCTYIMTIFSRLFLERKESAFIKHTFSNLNPLKRAYSADSPGSGAP